MSTQAVPTSVRRKNSQVSASSAQSTYSRASPNCSSQVKSGPLSGAPASAPPPSPPGPPSPPVLSATHIDWTQLKPSGHWPSSQLNLVPSKSISSRQPARAAAATARSASFRDTGNRTILQAERDPEGEHGGGRVGEQQ